MSLVPTQEAVHALPADRPWLHHIVETSEAVLTQLQGAPVQQLSHVALTERLPPALHLGALAAAIRLLGEEDLVVTFPLSGEEPGLSLMIVALTANGRMVLAARAEAQRIAEPS